MANDLIKFFNFYRRYKWRAEDFYDWQTAHLETLGGVAQGTYGAAVLQGFGFDAATGLSISVTPGFAVGPTGYFLCANEESDLTLAAPTGAGQGVRHLIVARPNIVQTDYIPSPTVPFSSVPLRQGFYTEVTVIPGTPGAVPEYNYGATGQGDVILFGVRLDPGASTVVSANVDMDVRDALGKNSDFQENTGRFDDRCRPYRSGAVTLGVKPSQLFGDLPRAFLYVSKTVASTFPNDGSGDFNTADSFYNMQTGVVTGGDAATPDFTPTIPSAGKYVIASIGLQSDNTIRVDYGTEGTLAQCIDALINQTATGPGGVTVPNDAYRIAAVLVGSQNGTTVSAIDVYDMRAGFTFGGPENAKTYPNVFLSSAGAGDTNSLATALSLLPAAGGVVLVMDQVTVAESSLAIPANTKLLGRGRGASLTFLGTAGIVTDDAVTIQDLILAATGSITMVDVAGDYNVFEKNTFEPPSGATASAVCIKVEGNGNHFGENVFLHTLTPALAVGIQFEAGYSENSEEYNVFTT